MVWKKILVNGASLWAYMYDHIGKDNPFSNQIAANINRRCESVFFFCVESRVGIQMKNRSWGLEKLLVDK